MEAPKSLKFPFRHQTLPPPSLLFVRIKNTGCFLKTDPPAICVLCDGQTVNINREYTEGTVFLTPAVFIFLLYVSTPLLVSLSVSHKSFNQFLAVLK